MKGFPCQAQSRLGHPGLPVKLGVEKASESPEGGYRKENICRRLQRRLPLGGVMKYTREWEALTSRMGYWVDTTDPYITYDNRYIEVRGGSSPSYIRKGYLYKGYTIQPYFPAAGTGLSSHELNQPGCYRDVKRHHLHAAQFTCTDPSPP